MIVITNEIADLLGVSAKYISELVLDHGMPKEAHNSYDVVKVLRWYVIYKEKEKQRALDKLREEYIENPKNQADRERARKLKLENEVTESKLIEKDVAVRIYGESVKILAKSLDALPQKVAPKLVQSEQNEIKEVLTRELDLIRNEIVESINKL